MNKKTLKEMRIAAEAGLEHGVANKAALAEAVPVLMILKSAAVVSAAKTLGKALLTATLATLGVSWFSGCSSMSTTPRGQTTEIVAVGIPAIAWISHTSQEADHRVGDTNAVSQANDVAVAVELK